MVPVLTLESDIISKPLAVPVHSSTTFAVEDPQMPKM